MRAKLTAADRTATVVVERPSARVVARRAPLEWRAYAMDDGCGGMPTPAFHALAPDARRPLARPTDGSDGGRPLPPTRLPYRVRVDDPLVVRLEATAARCGCEWHLEAEWSDCEWYLAADWSSGDRRGALRIDDGGRPFRTSGYAAGREYGYAHGTARWSR
ncbi:hypothetical protein [Streptomyces kanasensis]|uniref:hypothetical protein n=1 Tax=Streptomyces kanasensis TaxID=936756 RepID=UPI00382BAC19